MELYIQIIFVLALAKFCLKAAMTGRFWTMACYAFFAALVSLALYPTVIEQPATVITNLLADRELVTDGAVLTTTEAILGIFVSVFLLSNYFKPKGQRRKSVFVLKVVPGILWIFAVAYFELLFFRQRVGADFGATAAIYAGIVFAVVLLAAGFIHLFVRHESMKLRTENHAQHGYPPHRPAGQCVGSRQYRRLRHRQQCRMGRARGTNRRYGLLLPAGAAPFKNKLQKTH